MRWTNLQLTCSGCASSSRDIHLEGGSGDGLREPPVSRTASTPRMPAMVHSWETTPKISVSDEASFTEFLKLPAISRAVFVSLGVGC